MKARCDFALVRVASENVVISLANLCGSLALLFLTVSSLELPAPTRSMLSRLPDRGISTL